MNSTDEDGIVIEQSDEEPEIEDGHDTRQLQRTPAVELDSCSDVHVGTRLHYHGPVVVNQMFMNSAQEGELKQRAITAPVQQFEIIKDIDACWVGRGFVSVPEGAVLAGHDKDGGPLFVGRAFYMYDILPAKIAPKHRTVYVSFGGREHQVTNYEMLCNLQSIWQTARDGNVPSGALPVGSTRDGELLYVGRVFHDGTLTPGKVHPSHGVCYIPYNGREISFTEYEVLIKK